MCLGIPSCEVFPKGFKSFCIYRVMGGGGVFILVREDIDRVEDAFPNGTNFFESIWVQLRFFKARLLNKASYHGPPILWNESLALIHSDIGNNNNNNNGYF